MKNLLLIVLITFAFISCEKNEGEPFIYEPLILEDLTLDAVSHLIPLELLSDKTKAIFVNENGDEKILDIQFKREVIARKINGHSYNSEQASIFYSDPADHSYSIYIVALHQYSNINATFQLVHVSTQTSITASTQDYLFSSIWLGLDDSNCSFRHFEEYTLAGHVFEDVYTDVFPDSHEFPSYTKAYYTSTQSIIGFRGKYGEMWALKGYE